MNAHPSATVRDASGWLMLAGPVLCCRQAPRPRPRPRPRRRLRRRLRTRSTFTRSPAMRCARACCEDREWGCVHRLCCKVRAQPGVGWHCHSLVLCSTSRRKGFRYKPNSSMS